jgi:hypothetical protein
LEEGKLILAKTIVGIAVVLVAILVVYMQVTAVSETNPIALVEADGPKEELSQWKLIWEEPENEFKKAEVILDEPDSLKVRFEYKYAGGYEGRIFACGGIGIRKEHVKWSCRPAQISTDDGVAIVTFQTSKKAGELECSKLIMIDIYAAGQMPFYSNYFEYNKKWLRGESGLLGKLKQMMSSCPKNDE